MSYISFSQKGDFDKVTTFFLKIKSAFKVGVFDKYGRAGVALLTEATPVDTGLTAKSWYYKTYVDKEVAKLQFCNSNVNNGVPIAIILQYGHGTRNGGYVAGRDYINPITRPLFDDLAKEFWKEVADQ